MPQERQQTLDLLLRLLGHLRRYQLRRLVRTLPPLCDSHSRSRNHPPCHPPWAPSDLPRRQEKEPGSAQLHVHLALGAVRSLATLYAGYVDLDHRLDQLACRGMQKRLKWSWLRRFLRSVAVPDLVRPLVPRLPSSDSLDRTLQGLQRSTQTRQHCWIMKWTARVNKWRHRAAGHQ